MTRSMRGLVYGTAAYGIWGLLPLFWPLLEPASPLEILACRIVFSLLVVAALLAASHELTAMRRLDRGTLMRLGVAGVVIAVNWGAYIWGVNNHHVVETSLGYFINPLLTIALGVIVLRERLRAVQWIAVALGVLAVVLLGIDYGHPPWLALFLACSFATYGLIKKRTTAAAVQGLLVETAATVVPAVLVLTGLGITGAATWVGDASSPAHLVLLAASGPVTAVPLLFFAGAARRLPLSSLGLLQYLAPVMQFIIGVALRHEPLPLARLGGFALVWTALLVLTADAIRFHRRVPAAVASPGGVDLVGSR